MVSACLDAAGAVAVIDGLGWDSQLRFFPEVTDKEERELWRSPISWWLYSYFLHFPGIPIFALPSFIFPRFELSTVLNVILSFKPFQSHRVKEFHPLYTLNTAITRE